MPKPSSQPVEELYRGKHVRVFRLDREQVLSMLRERAAALVAACPEVIEVRLFGSLARSDCLPGSDADLWVLVKDGAPPLRERIARVSRHFEGIGIDHDVLVHTDSEWAELRRQRRRIVEAVLCEGIRLAGRDYP